jgi:hypothetical protein
MTTVNELTTSDPAGNWWHELRDPAFALFLLTVFSSLVRAPDQPSVDFSAGRTVVTLTPTDVLLCTLLVVVGARLIRARGFPAGTTPVLLAALAFGGWLAISAVANGATAVVSAGKLVELGVLTLAAAVLLDRVERFPGLIATLVTMTVAATVFGVYAFARDPGARQSSFLGEHDFATLSTVALAVGLISLTAGRGNLGRLPVIAGVAGSLGITLGASFASLIGLYLAAGALLVVAHARKSLRLRAALLTLLTCAAITAGTLFLRSDNLGFLHQWFGNTENTAPGTYAGSWSARLIYAYIGGRVFLDNPVTGTGWWGELPPQEYVRYLPDARERFSDQPPHYFPPEDGTFIPQQAYDQILFELGLIGAALLVALAVVATGIGLRVARRWPRSHDVDYVGYLPLTWLLAIGGALAGTALFGGAPLGALFCLVLGVVGAGGRLLAERGAREP